MSKTLVQRLRKEKIDAFKSKDSIKKGLIDTVLGEIDRDPNYRPIIVDGKKEDPSDKVVLETIKRLVKNLSIVENENSKAEIEILMNFLPQQLSEDELDSIITELIESTSSSSSRDMGKVMKEFTSNYNGQADNKIVSQMIRTKLLALESA